MKLTYAKKAKFISYALPLVIIIPCVLIGYRASRAIFAATPPATGIGISVNQAQYVVGQNVVVTLANTTSSNVYVTNNCPNNPLSVYKFDNNAWDSLTATTSSSKCIGEPSSYEIPANHSIKTDYRYWPNLFSQPGQYRIVANIEFFSQGPAVEFNVIN